MYSVVSLPAGQTIYALFIVKLFTTCAAYIGNRFMLCDNVLYTVTTAFSLV